MWAFIKDYPCKYWPWYVVGVISLIATTYVTTLIPLELKQIIDAIHETTPWLELKENIIQLIGLALILAVVRALSRILIFTPGRYVEYDLRKAIHKHLLTLPPSFFRAHRIGDIMSRTINDIQSLRLLSAFGFLHIVNTIMIYTLVLGQMVAINPTLTWLTLIPVPIAMILVRVFVKKLHATTKKSQQELGAITDFFVESVANMSLIKTYNAESQFLNEMQVENIRYKNTQLTLVGIRAIMFPFIASLGAVAGVILLIKGSALVVSNAISIGDFVAFSTYLTLLAWPTAAFSWIINIIQRGLVSLNRVQDILNTDAHPQFHLESRIKMDKPPSIRVDNLSFKYPSNTTPTLSDVSFTIPAKGSLGIFGSTGSGKTTLANILSLGEPIPNGHLFFDDVDVTTVNVSAYRDKISCVQQRRFLFSDSIKQNVAFSEPDAIQQPRLDRSVDRACVSADIAAFPDTWATMVGEKGVVLSGGQQHRLALARGYAAEHYVLILDDVLSSVDHDTEHQMIKALFNQPDRPTTVIISHRVSALAQCDHIIVLDAGRIIAQGSHDTLIKTPGLYKATHDYQLLHQSTDSPNAFGDKQ